MLRIIIIQEIANIFNNKNEVIKWRNQSFKLALNQKNFWSAMKIKQLVCSDNYKKLGNLLVAKSNNKLEWFK